MFKTFWSPFANCMLYKCRVKIPKMWHECGTKVAQMWQGDCAKRYYFNDLTRKWCNVFTTFFCNIRAIFVQHSENSDYYGPVTRILPPLTNHLPHATMDSPLEHEL